MLQPNHSYDELKQEHASTAALLLDMEEKCGKDTVEKMFTGETTHKAGAIEVFGLGTDMEHPVGIAAMAMLFAVDMWEPEKGGAVGGELIIELLYRVGEACGLTPQAFMAAAMMAASRLQEE